VTLEPHVDARGFFARSFCRDEFATRGLEPAVAQCNVSWSPKRGTLRGMHYQRTPHEEAKLVRCTRGAVFDVIVDLRAGSPTYREWLGIELTADNRQQLYIPRGFAHGLQTLVDDTEVSYQMSAPYEPGSATGFRYDDPAIAIRWPIAAPIVSDRDRQLGPAP
jgi:dTDP-4-dehydrorhamnose 3,5-epimerase